VPDRFFFLFLFTSHPSYKPSLPMEEVTTINVAAVPRNHHSTSPYQSNGITSTCSGDAWRQPTSGQTVLRHRPPPRLRLLNALGASYIYLCRITLHTLCTQMHPSFGRPGGQLPYQYLSQQNFTRYASPVAIRPCEAHPSQCVLSSLSCCCLSEGAGCSVSICDTLLLHIGA
jgi:hypothetical protein